MKASGAAPLHPQIEKLLERVARATKQPLHHGSPADARAAYEVSAPLMDVSPAELAAVDDLVIPARDGHPIPARLYVPREHSWAQPLPLLVFFHGGGFVVGSIATHDALCRMLAREADCLVLSVGYRLAPEHKFPAAVEDADDAVRWAFEQASQLGADPARIAVGGDSAGGTLATVCAVLARDAQRPLVLQLLIYPGTSARQDLPSHSEHGRGKLLTAEMLKWFFDHYLATPEERDDWRFAPLDGAGVGADVTGIAPAWIGVADHDPLFDDGVRYADKLKAAGVPVELAVYPGMIHDFFKMRRYVGDVAHAHADAVRALRTAFGTQ